MKLKVPYFDNLEAELEEEHAHHAAICAFLQLTPQNRITDSRHVYAYYRDFHYSVGGEDWLDEEMGVPKTPEDIWKYVKPGPIRLEKDRHDASQWYVFMEADCGWEQEHGLMMVWRNGTVLCKVSGYDGHPTNASSYADQSKDEIVYDGGKEFRTYVKGGFGT